MNNEEDADAIMGNDIYLPLKMLPNLPVTNSTMKLLVLKSKTNDLVLLGKSVYKRYDRSTPFEVLNGEIEILIQ
jgi:16S rRNA processing protein RimM